MCSWRRDRFACILPVQCLKCDIFRTPFSAICFPHLLILEFSFALEGLPNLKTLLQEDLKIFILIYNVFITYLCFIPAVNSCYKTKNEKGERSINGRFPTVLGYGILLNSKDPGWKYYLFLMKVLTFLRQLCHGWREYISTFIRC
jgi:hypothetical protein